DACIEEALLARDRFGGNMPFMHGLVSQHGLPDDVADGIDVRHVGAHLPVDRNEAPLIDRHARRIRADGCPVGAPTDGLQYQVVTLRTLDRKSTRLNS